MPYHGPPYHVVVASIVLCSPIMSLLTLIGGPPLPVITHMHQPSSLQAVACSRGVWCHGHHHLPLVPVIILSHIGGASAGADAIGIDVGIIIIIIISSHPSPPPFLLVIIMEIVTGPLAPIPPCKKGLAVVGAGCLRISMSLPCPSSWVLLSLFHLQSTP